MERITTEDHLRQVLGHPAETTQLKIHGAMTRQAVEFVGRSPILFLGTSDRAGLATVSPKGDEPGFVRVEDDRTLLIPERRGNRLLMSYQNLLENDRAGLLFVVPGVTETLRVHGRASLLVDEALCAGMAVLGKPALLVVRFQVEQCFFHCGKAFIRSKLWKPESWPAAKPVSFGEEIAPNACPADPEAWIRNLDEAVQDAYRNNL